MSTDLETVPAANPLAIISAAMERGADPDQLEKLLALQERYDRNRAAEAFGEALTSFQAECPPIQKTRTAKIFSDKGSYEYRFANYEDVMSVAQPILARHRLAVSVSTQKSDTGILVTTRIRHGTHFEESTLDVPVPAMKVNDTQRFGAALSYAKRYGLCAALNIVVCDEDNDAGGLGEKVTEQQVATLVEWIESKAASREKFLKHYKISKLGDLPAARFDEAVELLRRK